MGKERSAADAALKLLRELNTDTPYGPVLVPSAGAYRSIFAWDSGWHYFWLKHLDPGRAALEIKTVFHTQQSDGRIPHETVFDTRSDYSLNRKIQLFLLKSSFDRGRCSFFIDPPVYLTAALDIIKEKTGGNNTAVPDADSETFFYLRGTVRKLRWIYRSRILRNLPYPANRMPFIMHPFESGTDMSPQFDEIYGGKFSLLIKSVTMLKKIAAVQWSFAEPDGNFRVPIICDLTYITFYYSALLELKELIKKNNWGCVQIDGIKLAEDESLNITSGEIDDVCDYLYDRENMCFLPLYIHRGKIARASALTVSSFLPFLVPTNHGGRGRDAAASIKKHLVPGRPFYRGILPSFNPFSSAEISPGDRNLSSLLWRGPCSWMNMNYCVWRLYMENGFPHEASALRDSLMDYIERAGLYEYFNAFAYKGGGALPFSWNGLILAMYRDCP